MECERLSASKVTFPGLIRLIERAKKRHLNSSVKRSSKFYLNTRALMLSEMQSMPQWLRITTKLLKSLCVRESL